MKAALELRILTYIDNWLILASSPLEAETYSEGVGACVTSGLCDQPGQELAITISADAVSRLSPGLEMIEGLSLSLERQTTLLSPGQQLLSSPPVMPQQIRSLLGMMTTHPVVRLGLQHMSNLQC